MDDQNKSTDSETLAGLRNKESGAFEILYKFYYPPVERFVLSNNGSVDDAKDVFQETVIVLLDKVPMDDFKLSSSLKTYIYSISSNIWLKRLREAKRAANVQVKEVFAELHGSGTYANQIHTAQERKVRTLMDKISAHCRRLLNLMFFRKKTIDEIVKEEGYSNAHTAQNQKYKCIQQAKKQAELK